MNGHTYTVLEERGLTQNMSDFITLSKRYPTDNLSLTHNDISKAEISIIARAFL